MKTESAGRLGKNRSAGLDDFSAADAGGADLFADDGPVFHNANGLNVGFERSGRDFHDMHTDTAFFLCQTSADNAGPVYFLFAADFTNIAHSQFLRNAVSGFKLWFFLLTLNDCSA